VKKAKKPEKSPENLLDDKKKAFQERVGDWVCIKCKNLNFSFRVICNRCQLPKMESEKMFDQYMSNLMNYVKFNEVMQKQLVVGQGGHGGQVSQVGQTGHGGQGGQVSHGGHMGQGGSMSLGGHMSQGGSVSLGGQVGSGKQGLINNNSININNNYYGNYPKNEFGNYYKQQQQYQDETYEN
jgi:hypothetical protein